MGPLVGACLRMGVSDWESRELWELGYATRLDEHAGTGTGRDRHRVTPEQTAIARHRAATAGQEAPDPGMARQQANPAEVALLADARAKRGEGGD